MVILRGRPWLLDQGDGSADWAWSVRRKSSSGDDHGDVEAVPEEGLGELHHGDHVADAGAGVQDDGLLGHGHGDFLVHGGQRGREMDHGRAVGAGSEKQREIAGEANSSTLFKLFFLK